MCRKIIFCFVCAAMCVVPGISYAIDFDFVNTSEFVTAAASVKAGDTFLGYPVDYNTTRIALDSSSGPNLTMNVELEVFGTPTDAYAIANVLGHVEPTTGHNGANAIANIELAAMGYFSGIPQYTYDSSGHLSGAQQAHFDGGAFAGIQTTLVTSPTQGAVDPFWGKEVEGMPVVVKRSVEEGTSISQEGTSAFVSSFPVNGTSPDAYDYHYGREAWDLQTDNPDWSVKPYGGGSNAIIQYGLPAGYHAADPEAKLISMDRAGGFISSGSWGGTHNKSMFSQIGNTMTVAAEADFYAVMPSVPENTPWEIYYCATQSTPGHDVWYFRPVTYTTNTTFVSGNRLSWEVSLIDPQDVGVAMAPNVPEITRDAQAGFTSAHAGQAMMAKFWEERTAERPGANLVTHSDQELMATFKDYPNSGSGRYAAKNMNTFFSTDINPELQRIGKPSDALAASYVSYLGITEDEFIREVQAGRPTLLQGKLTDEDGNQLFVRDATTGSLVPATHASVAYGIMDDGMDGTWLAFKDTWDSSSRPLVEGMDEDRMWVQDGGFVTTMYGYSTVQWYPAPDVEAHEPIGLLPKAGQTFGLLDASGNPVSGNALWAWESFTFARPMNDSPKIAYYAFNTGVDLDNISPILNPLGSMAIDNNALHMVTPDGSPVGFSLDTILPEDFSIQFNYAGAGNGIIQIQLDGKVIKEIPLLTGEVDQLLTFAQTFHAADLAIDPYKLNSLSFILKGAGDPEVYLSNLQVRNLNAVPEPVSAVLFVLGGAVLIGRARRKKK